MLLKHGKHFKEGTVGQKARAFKVLTSIIVGGLVVGAAYKKVTGRRENPYNPLTLLAYEPGGLAIGAVQAVSDVYANTIMAVNGDHRALSALDTAIPRLNNMFIPFYDYTLRGYEAITNQKNVDTKAIRRARELLSENFPQWFTKYKMREDAYVLERDVIQKWQYLIAGAGIDVAIKERNAENKKIPVSDIWEKIEGKEKSTSDIWSTFDTEKKSKSSVWETF